VDRAGHAGRQDLRIETSTPGAAPPKGSHRSSAPVDAGAQRTDPPLAKGLIIAHLVTLVLAAVVLAYVNRQQWFFGDDWEFLSNRGFRGALINVWVPHTVHWSTIPILISVALRATFGLGSYWPFIAVLITGHLVLVHLLWRVSLRAGATPAIATAGALVFALLGAGSENLLWAFQIGFVGSLAFGWAAALVADAPGRLGRRDAGVITLLIASLLSSGIGVPLVVMVTLLVLLRSRNWLRAAVVGAIPGGIFLVWYRLIGSINNQPAGSASRSVGAVAGRTAKALVTVAESVTGGTPQLVQIAIVIAAGWWLFALVKVVRGRSQAQGLALVLVGPVAAALFIAIVALGRTELGAPRYFYVVTAMAIPAVLVALSAAARLPWLQGVVVAVLAVVGIHNVVLLKDASVLEATREQALRKTVVAAAYLVTTRDDFLASQPEPTSDPDIRVDSLRRFVADYGFPVAPVTAVGTNNALLALMVAAPAPRVFRGAPGPGAIFTAEVRATQSPTGEACWVPADGAVSPRVELRASGRGEAFRLEESAGPPFQLQVGTGAAASNLKAVPALPGAPARVVENLPTGTVLTVNLPAAGGALCGVR
jgi:hypothetical protein